MRAIRLTAAALALLAAPACLVAAQAQTPPVAAPQVAPAADANPVVARVGDEEVHRPRRPRRRSRRPRTPTPWWRGSVTRRCI
jgi:hypothetical protein